MDEHKEYETPEDRLERKVASLEGALREANEHCTDLADENEALMADLAVYRIFAVLVLDELRARPYWTERLAKLQLRIK